MPIDHSCIFCGAKYTCQFEYSTNMSGGKWFYYKCRECNRYHYYNKKTGKWEEYPRNKPIRASCCNACLRASEQSEALLL